MGRSLNRMGKEAPPGPGSPSSVSNKGGEYSSSSRRSDGGASAIAQAFISQSFFRNNFWIALTLATTYVSVVSAQSSFSMDSSSYDCSSTLICLGSAHVLNNTGSNIISQNIVVQVGSLSLIPEEPETAFMNAGVAYYKEPVQLLDEFGNPASFSTYFAVTTSIGVNSTDTGDGMAFIISANNSTVGTFGDTFGVFLDSNYFVTPYKSIVVEFDTWQNKQAPVFDISNNHVSFDFGSITAVEARNAWDADLDLSGKTTGHQFYAWVDYSNQTQKLELRISKDTTKPGNAFLNYTVDLSELVEEYMWAGFASGSEAFFSNYYIGNWTFESNFNSTLLQTLAPAGVADRGSESGSKVSFTMELSLGILASLLACSVVGLSLHIARISGGTRGCCCRWKLHGRMGSVKDDEAIHLQGVPKRFSYKELSDATGNFSEESKLGQGGFGSVYRGVLPSSGIPVAVKRISRDSSQGEKEFMAEVSIISRLRHKNLIQLLGWCNHATKAKFLLVYELMPNGSLDKVLFGSVENETVCLSWPQRFKIVTGTAAALEYLHEGWTQQVIHRDIKPSNIMLDVEWNAKLGDFGLARLVDHQRVASTTVVVVGTYGYIAPESATTGKFTDKSDVYAFGAVVLEIACGRKALATDVPEEEMFLVDWVWHRLREGNLMSTVDKRLENYDAHSMETMLTLGLLCSHPHPQARPTMREIVKVLAGDVPVPSILSSQPAPLFRSYPSNLSINRTNSETNGSISRSESTSEVHSAIV